MSQYEGGDDLAGDSGSKGGVAEEMVAVFKKELNDAFNDEQKTYFKLMTEECYSNMQTDLDPEEDNDKYVQYYMEDLPEVGDFGEVDVADMTGDQSLQGEPGSQACFSFVDAYFNQKISSEGAFANPVTGTEYQITDEQFLKVCKGFNMRLERELAGSNAAEYKNPFGDGGEIYKKLIETQATDAIHNEPILSASSLLMQFGN